MGGHQAGDRVLSMVASTLSSAVRQGRCCWAAVGRRRVLSS
ncbi:hypothetical protein LNQ52_20490 [Klebsiella pneumoniae subsp. pneumoniae]|nr:hypothetical protein [Klebsiella pneumoniae subsp. pneumoniae]